MQLLANTKRTLGFSILRAAMLAVVSLGIEDREAPVQLSCLCCFGNSEEYQ